MSSAEDKIQKIREILDRMEKELSDCRRILKGENQCTSCRFWAGSCGKGKVNRTASSEACELFEQRGSFKA